MLLVIAKLRVKCGRLTIYATTTTATYEATSADAIVAAYVGFVFFGRFIAVAIIAGANSNRQRVIGGFVCKILVVNVQF